MAMVRLSGIRLDAFDELYSKKQEAPDTHRSPINKHLENKIKPTSNKDALCQVWLKFGSGKDFKFFSIYLNFSVIISPWKLAWPFI